MPSLRSTPVKPSSVGGHVLSHVGPEVYGVTTTDHVYKKVEHASAPVHMHGTSFATKHAGRSVDPWTSGQKSPNNMSNAVYMHHADGHLIRVKRKLVSQTRKWGDSVDISFESEGGLTLEVICQPLQEGGEETKKGAVIDWSNAPGGQYKFSATAAKPGTYRCSVSIHGVESSLEFYAANTEQHLCFEIEATSHNQVGKVSDNYSLFRYSDGSKTTATAMH